jgi:hypothetical protein
MIDIFLKAKHWQLFLVMIGIPIAFQFYSFSKIWEIQSSSEPKLGNEGFSEVLNEQFIQNEQFTQFAFFTYVMIFCGLVFFGWFWSIAIGLQKNISPDIKMKVKKFKILFFIPLGYFLLLMLYMDGLFSGMPNSGFLNSGWIVAIILPLHLFSMFCIFYSMYFVAKTIKTVELQRKVGFGDFAGDFFLLWFYFIGIWIIQPKVNRFYGKENTTGGNGSYEQP